MSLLFAILTTFHAFADSDWQLINDKSDVKVFRREIEGSRLVAFKGSGPVHAPIAKVAGVLLDDKRTAEWVDKLKEIRIIKKPGPHEWIIYSSISSGYWLVKDRDFVSRVKLEISSETKSVTLRYQPTVDDQAPPTHNHVRGEIINSAFILTPIEDGAGTLVTVEILADPKGFVPKWIVNMAQKSWPINTIERMRSQAAKKDIADNEEVEEIFAGKYQNKDLK